MSEIDFKISEVFPHPIQRVWEAITTPVGLEAWLMPNDFKLIKGYECTFRFCSSEEDEQDSQVVVRVIDYEAPYHLVWHWRNDGEPEYSTVTFSLNEVDGGTELTLQHTGQVSDKLADKLTKGWPSKMATLGLHLGKN